MRFQVQLGVCLCLLASVAGGCRLWNDQAVVQGHSPLQPARPSPDSVTMEIIWARFPAGDPAINEEAWQEIDETKLAPAVHRELVRNGLRAGVVGPRLPNAIARALRQGESPPEAMDLAASEQTIELAADPVVHGRVQRLRRHQRSEIQASEVYASLPLLVSGERELSGHTYEQAQAVYALRVDPQPDRSVRVELTPELHHGAARLRWAADEGIGLRQAALRDREVFDALRLSLSLAPGEMLVLTSLPDAGSRLGHYFHTVNSAEGAQQKLILIRLAEVPPSDTFAGGAGS